MLGGPEDKGIEWIAQALERSRRLLFITGAGVSADSGLPTYRGIGGLYADRPTEHGFPIEVALSGPMFESRPEITWQHIHEIEAACRGASFNRSHEVIARLQAHFEVVVLTQNVDGFHRAAGSQRVIDIHGDLHQLLCTRCEYRRRVEDYADLAPLPRCPECRAVVRPEVVLFGEMLPKDKLGMYAEEMDQGFDLVFSVGTTSVFPYIAAPVLDARRKGVATVEINPGRSEVSDLVDLQISRSAALVFEALWTRLGDALD